MSRARRTLTTLLVAGAIGLCAVTTSGCGAVSHAVGGIVAHHIANRVLGRRTAGKVFCVYHGHRLFVDLRHGSKLAAAINAYEAYRSCKQGFGHRTG